jgi:hypothetical protein
MKFKSKYSIYAPDLVGILVAITFIAWSIRGQRHDKSFTYSIWLSFIIFLEFFVINVFKFIYSRPAFVENGFMVVYLFITSASLGIFLIFSNLEEICSI